MLSDIGLAEKLERNRAKLWGIRADFAGGILECEEGRQQPGAQEKEGAGEEEEEDSEDNRQQFVANESITKIKQFQAIFIWTGPKEVLRVSEVEVRAEKRNKPRKVQQYRE